MVSVTSLTAAEVLRLVALSNFRKMDRYDREAFSGVESDEALIHGADERDEGYTIILDGERICLIDEWGYESQFYLGANIFA